MNLLDSDGALEVRVHLGDLGPYPGRMLQVVDEPDMIDFWECTPRISQRAAWCVNVTGVPYRDAYAIRQVAAGGWDPVEPVLTCNGWPQRYTAKAWLRDLGYHVGPRPPGGDPFDRGEWLMFTLQSVGTVRDLQPVRP